MTGTQYHFKRKKEMNLREGTVTYKLEMTCKMDVDPGQTATIEYFEEFIRQLKMRHILKGADKEIV